MFWLRVVGERCVYDYERAALIADTCLWTGLLDSPGPLLAVQPGGLLRADGEGQGVGLGWAPFPVSVSARVLCGASVFSTGVNWESRSGVTALIATLVTVVLQSRKGVASAAACLAWLHARGLKGSLMSHRLQSAQLLKDVWMHKLAYLQLL